MGNFEVLLASIGLTAILSYSSIADKVKTLLSLDKIAFFYCPQCLGFWVGLSSGLLADQKWHALATGFSVSILSRLLAAIIARLEQ